MNIAVVFGGISPERNVSIAGGIAVVKALQELGHTVKPIDPAYGANGLRNIEELEAVTSFPTDEELAQFSTKSLIECVNSELFDNVDVVFILLHGHNGEDGKFQALLDLRGVPYTGSGVKASSLAIDKLSSKILFQAAGIPTPSYIPVRKDEIDDYDFYKQVRSELGKNVIVKPNDQGSTIGITHVKSGILEDIQLAAKNAAKYSDRLIIEQFIKGREITVGMLGDEALPIVEILPDTGFYDYEHKYTKGKTEYVCPADILEDIDDFTRNAGYTAYRVLGCRGFGRVDFRLDEDGQPFCLEVNTIPGFTELSLVPMAAKEIGMDFKELCQRIIDLALEE